MIRLAIVGFGQMGASIAASLRPKGYRIVAIDRDAETRRKARERGLADEASEELSHCRAADIVLLALPVRTSVEILPPLLDEMRPDALLLDLATTKGPLVESFLRSVRPIRYVSLHPLAGTERSGIDAADPALFHGTACLVIPIRGPEEAIDSAEGIVRSLGACPIRIRSVDEHDRAMAVMIHLPHVLAYVLPMLARESGTELDLAGRSFRDMTRVALSDGSMVLDFLLTNRVKAGEALDRFLELLVRFRELLMAEDEKGLRRWMEEAKEIRGQVEGKP